jgi:hypothetical protein
MWQSQRARNQVLSRLESWPPGYTIWYSGLNASFRKYKHMCWKCLQALEKQLLLKDFEHWLASAVDTVYLHFPWSHIVLNKDKLWSSHRIIIHFKLMSSKLMRFYCNAKCKVRDWEGVKLIQWSSLGKKIERQGDVYRNQRVRSLPVLVTHSCI